MKICHKYVLEKRYSIFSNMDSTQGTLKFFIAQNSEYVISSRDLV